MDNPIAMKIVEAVEQLPQQGFDSVGVNGRVQLLPVMPYNLIEVMLRVIECEVEGHVGVVNVDIDELDDILVVNLAQEHDLPDSGRRYSVPLLGLLELLDGDGGPAPAGRRVGRLEAREEDEAVGPLADLAHQLVLLQPRRAIGAARAPVSHPRRRTGLPPQLGFLSPSSSSPTPRWLSACFPRLVWTSDNPKIGRAHV